jgi:c-di-GMP-binding flagellar brake protein YcgR
VEPSILQAERRRYPRTQIAVQIEIRPQGIDVPMRLETTDLSLGGCYVEMALTLDIETKLDIVLWLDGQKVSTRGVVVTRHPQFGNGIEFVGMFSESERKLRCFLDSRDPSWHTRPVS